jgi:hypothetical protein
LENFKEPINEKLKQILRRKIIKQQLQNLKNYKATASNVAAL